MKKVLAVAVLVVLTACSAGYSAPVLTADDFTSPIQAPEEQREKLLTVQSPDAVKTEDDHELEVQVTSAITAQDAINAIVQRHEEGCNMVAMPGGGYGFVATGMGTYRKDMKNITALRIAQRNAYVQALMQAKVQMAGQASGLAMNGRTNFDQFVSAEDTDTQSTSRSSSSTSESIRSTVAAVLKGYVTYNVYDDFENGLVYVTIVSTPKTRGVFSRVIDSTIAAENINAGINAVLAELQSGLMPLVGGRIVEDPVTGEIAFVGFGSAVVRQTNNPAMKAQLLRTAQASARLRAEDALCGIIVGDVTRGMTQLDEQTRESITSYVNAEAQDPMNGYVTSLDIAEAEKGQNEFRTNMQFSQTIETARRGTLPQGVGRRAWIDEEGAFAYAVAIYRPSMTNAAAGAAKEMRETQIIQPVTPYETGTNLGDEEENSSRPGYKDSGKFHRNATGTVKQPL